MSSPADSPRNPYTVRIRTRPPARGEEWSPRDGNSHPERRSPTARGRPACGSGSGPHVAPKTIEGRTANMPTGPTVTPTGALSSLLATSTAVASPDTPVAGSDRRPKFPRDEVGFHAEL